MLFFQIPFKQQPFCFNNKYDNHKLSVFISSCITTRLARPTAQLIKPTFSKCSPSDFLLKLSFSNLRQWISLFFYITESRMLLQLSVLLEGASVSYPGLISNSHFRQSKCCPTENVPIENPSYFCLVLNCLLHTILVKSHDQENAVFHQLTFHLYLPVTTFFKNTLHSNELKNKTKKPLSLTKASMSHMGVIGKQLIECFTIIFLDLGSDLPHSA